MYEIQPNLYLSAYHHISLDNCMNPFIVNCTKNLDMLSTDNIRIAVDDNGSQEALDILLTAFPSAVNIIDRKLKNDQTVVVHCLAGRQRSAAVIAAYLMAKCGYTLDDAIGFIKKKKVDAFFPNINFLWSLEQYESRCTSVKPMTQTY